MFFRSFLCFVFRNTLLARLNFVFDCVSDPEIEMKKMKMKMEMSKMMFINWGNPHTPHHSPL